MKWTPLSICSQTVWFACSPWSAQMGEPRFQCRPTKETTACATFVSVHSSSAEEPGFGSAAKSAARKAATASTYAIQNQTELIQFTFWFDSDCEAYTRASARSGVEAAPPAPPPTPMPTLGACADETRGRAGEDSSDEDACAEAEADGCERDDEEEEEEEDEEEEEEEAPSPAEEPPPGMATD